MASKRHKRISHLGSCLKLFLTRRIDEVLCFPDFWDRRREIGLTWSERVTYVQVAHDRVQPHLVSAVANFVVTLQVAPVEPHSSRLHIAPFLNVWPSRVMSGTVFNCAGKRVRSAWAKFIAFATSPRKCAKLTCILNTRMAFWHPRMPDDNVTFRSFADLRIAIRRDPTQASRSG